jgi:hypothetical protein
MFVHQEAEITALDYWEDQPMIYNYYVYRFDLKDPLEDGIFKASTQPFTAVPKTGITPIAFK